MKNYSNPYQAPALEMLDGEIITSKYNGRVEQGFRALFAGTDGWYDLYRDANGNVYKSKLGAGGSSGGGGGNSGVTEDFLNDNYYNKTIIDDKFIETKNQIPVRHVNDPFDTLVLSQNVSEYYFYIDFTFADEQSPINISYPNEANGVWYLNFIGVASIGGSYEDGRNYIINLNNGYDKHELTIYPAKKTTIQCSILGNDYTTRQWKDVTSAIKTDFENLQAMISSIPKFSTEVVSDLPTTKISSSTVYLLTNNNPEKENLYSEYIYIDNKWELLGTQTSNINLSDYYTKEEIDNKNYLTKEGLEENNIGLSSFVNDMGYVLPGEISETLQNCGVLDDNYNSVIPLIQENIQDLQTHVLNPFDEEEHPLTFTTNKIYKLEATDNNLELTFEDVVENEKEQLNQILIYLKLTQETAIKWLSQVYFVGDQIPSLAQGHYRIIAEFNPFLEKWVIGVIQDGPEISSEEQ